MYKNLLLTQKETKLLLEIINQIDYCRQSNLKSERNNIHIIKRNLLGLIPTKNYPNKCKMGNKPTY